MFDCDRLNARKIKDSSDVDAIMNNQEKTAANRKSAQQVHSGKKALHPKTSKFYWLDKVKRPTSSSGGVSPHYGVQIKHQDRRMRFPLYSASALATSALIKVTP